MPNITVIALRGQAIALNTMLTLRKVEDNPSDESAVAVMDGEKQVGWVANSEATCISGTFSATDVAARWLSNAKCAAVHVAIRKAGSFVNKAGEKQTRYRAEVFIQPVRESSNANSVVKEYMVGGLSAHHTMKYMVQDRLQKNGAGFEVVLKPWKDGNGKDKVGVFLPDVEESKSCGAIMNDSNAEMELSELDDNIKKALQRSSKLTGTVLRGSGNSSYVVSVAFSSGGEMDKFYPDIDAAIARGVDQSPALEKRVNFMLGVGFTANKIKKVLAQMPAYWTERANIPKPSTPYIQKEGSNLADMVTYMLKGKRVQLVGPKGAGKNTLIETGCWLLGRPMCRLQGSDDISKMDFEGARTLKDGSTEFELSEMYRTLQAGGIVVVDEANMVRPNVLAALHSLTDNARCVNVSGYGLVKMDPHACIVFTLNEGGYAGTNDMNEATVDRGPVLAVEQESDMRMLLAHAVPTADKDDIALCCKVAEAIKKAVSEGQMTPEAETIRGYIDALECAEDIPLKRGLIHNVANKVTAGPHRIAVEAIISSNCA